MINFDIKNFIINNDKIHSGYNNIIQNEMRTIHNHVNGQINDPFDALCSLNELGLKVTNCHINDIIQEFLKEINVNNNLVVITGPIVKTFIVKYDDVNEIPISHSCNILFISEINKTFDTKSYEKENISFHIENKLYVSPAHAILSNPIQDRIGMFNNEIYASYTFLIELYKKVLSYDSTYIDPIYKCPVDILDIYDKKQLKKYSIQGIIDSANFNEIKNITNPTKHIIQCNNNSYNLAEYALTKLMTPLSPFVISVIKEIILHLGTFRYARPPIFLAILIEINKTHEDLYNAMISIDHNGSRLLTQNDINLLLVEIKSTVHKSSFVNTSSIDLCILKYLIKNDNVKLFLEYGSELGYLKKMITISKTGDKFAHWIMTFNATNILKELIKCNIINSYYKHKLILLTQSIELIKSINTDEHNLSDFIYDVIKNNATKSFLFLIELYPDILYKSDPKNKGTLLHSITSDKLFEIVRIIKQKAPCTLNVSDSHGNTPLLTFSELGLTKCINELLSHSVLNIDIQSKTDMKGNNFVHILCQNGHYDILKQHIKNINSNLKNMQNNAMETPVILACKNKHELIFYLLKSCNVDFDIVDQFGNSAYHYICLNGICPGITINNKKNNFGFTPMDYCTISHDFYYFN